jgi:Tfp pilus assembly protein PilV
MVSARGRLKAASQEGFALMEVIIAAAVLVLVVLGVLAGMDAMTSTAGANKARTVSATLAEKDQERLRGMKTMDIDQMNTEPYDVMVGSVKYHVESKAVWVYDASGDEVSCGVAQGQASYMRITSTVTSNKTGGAVKPVVMSSIVAPQVGASAAGSLSVQVKNAQDQGVPDVLVTAPPAAPERTNALGCAVFGQLTAGTYVVTLNKSGYVDKEGVTNPSKPATVTAGNMSTLEFAYDLGAEITVDVKTKPGTGGVDDPAASVLGANPELGAGLRSFSLPSAFSPAPSPAYPTDSVTTGTPATVINTYTGRSMLLTNLFPFKDGYTFFSGRCIANDPSKYVTDYFDTHTGRVTLDPGDRGKHVEVYEPPTRFVVKFTSTARGNANVYAYPTGAACGGVRIPLGVTQSSGNTGKVTYPGLPYGDYQICAEWFRSSNSTWYEGVVNTFRNGTEAGPASDTTINVDSGAGNRCGATAP